MAVSKEQGKEMSERKQEGKSTFCNLYQDNKHVRQDRLSNGEHVNDLTNTRLPRQ